MDSIKFTPHNVVSVDILPEYPMTIAVMAKDNADPKTGLEYGSNIGDGGFCLKLGDGTVTSASWKAKNFFRGPLNRDTQNPKVEHTYIPTNWFTVDFEDSQWSKAKEFTEAEVGPKQPFYEHDFKGAKFIWSDDVALDNTVIFRTRSKFRFRSPTLATTPGASRWIQWSQRIRSRQSRTSSAGPSRWQQTASPSSTRSRTTDARTRS